MLWLNQNVHLFWCVCTVVQPAYIFIFVFLLTDLFVFYSWIVNVIGHIKGGQSFEMIQRGLII